MGAERGDRGRNDDGKRGADAERHAHFQRHADEAEAFVEHGDQHRAAADAEDAGHEAGDRAHRKQQQRQLDHFGDAEACDRHLRRLSFEGHDLSDHARWRTQQSQTFINRASGIPAIGRAACLSTPANAGLMRRYELRFALSRFLHCTRCFDFVNRIYLRASCRAVTLTPPTPKSRHDHQDRTTAFAASADLSLDADDGAVHRPPRHRRGAVFRHLAARLVADCRRLRPRCLRQCAGVQRQHHRQADPVRLHMGAAAPSALRLAPLRLGSRLRLQGQ